MVEAQQQAMLDNPHMPLRNLNIDAGSMRARKIIDEMIAAETRTVAA